MRYEPISPWIDPPADITPGLREDLRADVAIIGAGYTGLSAALALRAEGLDVVVLEQEFAGFGASGRNAGHLTPTIGKDLPTLLRLFGKRRTAALVRFADRAVEYTESLIDEHGIECDYSPGGNIMAAVHPKQSERLQRAAATGAELGAHVRFLPAGEMRERGLPRAFHCGVLEENGGTLHPGRYVSGLRRAALAAGVRLHEQTPVVAIEGGAAPRVRSAAGSVAADKVVLATNAYTPLLGWKARAVIPLRVCLLETEPIGDDRRRALGWQGREGVYTAHETLESYHLTARGTIVCGSKVAHYAYGSKLASDHDTASLRIVEAAFRERFAELGDLQVARFWGGWIAYPLDFIPSLGAADEKTKVYFGLGYAGHGVAQATLMGPMLADLIMGRENESVAALQRRAWTWPPEPLRWLAFNLVTGILDVVDRRTDRQIRTLDRKG